mmetsp:Transcript_15850/g.28223  ORF Transcript_15850/g.28223 Transcript_15850/m.28223 type:complete len:111 (-) Transcript_15850:445-777(-)
MLLEKKESKGYYNRERHHTKEKGKHVEHCDVRKVDQWEQHQRDDCRKDNNVHTICVHERHDVAAQANESSGKDFITCILRNLNALGDASSYSVPKHYVSSNQDNVTDAYY